MIEEFNHREEAMFQLYNGNSSNSNNKVNSRDINRDSPRYLKMLSTNNKDIPNFLYDVCIIGMHFVQRARKMRRDARAIGTADGTRAASDRPPRTA